MAKFSKIQVLQSMQQTGLIPVFYHQNTQTAQSVLKACYEGGIRAFEFTNRGDSAIEVFKELISYAHYECPHMRMGAGTIIDAPTAALYMQYGADFIVGPYLNTDVAKVCNRHLVPYIPGCGSVTEIGMAQEVGCDMVKIFPAGSVGGPSFVKNVKAPLPWTMIMATGAVEPTTENLSDWIKAGTTCVGMGSKLFSKKIIEDENWVAITKLCDKCLEIICNAKES